MKKALESFHQTKKEVFRRKLLFLIHYAERVTFLARAKQPIVPALSSKAGVTMYSSNDGVFT